MCENYKYMLQIKPEFDLKYKKTGIRSQMIYLCEVKDVANGTFKLNYDDKRFNLLVKECGKCYICRYKKASIKACQAQSEYKTVGKGAFITLTFGSKKMTDYILHDKRYSKLSSYKKNKYINYLQWTLEKKEFVNFIKRLRWFCYQEDLKKFSIEKGYFDNFLKKNGEFRNKILKLDKYDYSDFKPRKIRYLHCGEYGEKRSRPHHHAIIYGVDFSFDKSCVRYSWKKKRNVVVHFNNVLNDLWQFGDITTDKVTYQSCNYVARYVTKKIVNKNKQYSDKDIAGSIYKGRLPEYCTQSNRRGLGYDYYMKNASKINKDLQLSFMNNKGEIKYVPLPRYFKELMRKHFKSDWLRMQKLSIEKQTEFSSTEPELLLDRMISDKIKGKKQYIDFIGDLEFSNINKKCIDYNIFELKKKVFSNYSSILDIYRGKYNDTEFIDKEYWRITCYKNFEKYRKCLLRKVFQDFVFSRVNNPDLKNQVYHLQNKKDVIKLLDNPFTKDNIDFYCIKNPHLKDEFLEFDRSKIYA